MAKARVYTLGTLAVLVVLFFGRRFFVQPVVAWMMLNLVAAFMGFSMTDPNFAAIVTKPDNVPIVGMVFLLGFFTWLATWKAVQNDERIAQGLGAAGKGWTNEKVLVWPDLVYTELICMVALTALLIVWAIGLQAPLEEPASSVKTPNPSKAPWYFLGLQEMLVYFDPWMAGVVLPSLVVVRADGDSLPRLQQEGQRLLHDQRATVRLPHLSVRLSGAVGHADRSGHVPARARTGTSSGRTKYWDAHKVEALNNVDLSQYFWITLAGNGVAQGRGGCRVLARSSVHHLARVARHLLLTFGYFALSCRRSWR